MINISYKTLLKGILFSAGIAVAGVINYLFGLESTVIIMGGVCGLLAAMAIK